MSCIMGSRVSNHKSKDISAFAALIWFILCDLSLKIPLFSCHFTPQVYQSVDHNTGFLPDCICKTFLWATWVYFSALGNLMQHGDTVHPFHTCFQVHVQLVSVSIEGPVELQFYLEGLSSADDQLVPVIQVSVVLLPVLTRLRAQQVHRTHRQLYFWERESFNVKFQCVAASPLVWILYFLFL